MKKINKTKEPKEWLEYRQTPGVEFSAIKELKESLLHEQGYLCAYCMRRIDIDKMKVEHIKPRRYEDKIFDYNNLVACCEGKFGDLRFCDTNKENREISINLFDQLDIDTISYSSKDGAIRSSNVVYSIDINEVLNLNCRILKENRIECLNGVILALGKGGSWKGCDIRKKIKEYQSRDKDGRFKEYCGIVIWFLEKKMKKLV